LLFISDFGCHCPSAAASLGGLGNGQSVAWLADLLLIVELGN